MSPSWTKKDDEMYSKVRESELDRGLSPERAEEIAARTVNKRRRLEGRTPNKTTQGTGDPNAGLELRSVQELRNRASEMKIEGRSKMKKEELIQAIRDAE
jgi:hypothetical protein